MDIPTVHGALLHADGLTTSPTGLGGLGLSGSRPRRRGRAAAAAAASVTGGEVAAALGRAYSMTPGDGAAAAGALLEAGALEPTAAAGVGPGVGGEGATRIVDAVRYVLVYARDGRAVGLNAFFATTTALVRGEAPADPATAVAAAASATTIRHPFPLTVRPAPEFVSSFNDTFGAICANVLLRGGREVQYERLRTDPSWRVYLAHVAEAAHVTDWAALTPAARLSFLFNLYNGLVMHAKLVYGHAGTLASRGSFFNTAAYVLGGVRYSLVELEHGLLRRKAAADKPSSAAPPSPLIVDTVEPRMHFALNCGARSCPPVRAYLADGLEAQLAAAAADFIDYTLEVGGGATGKAAPPPAGPDQAGGSDGSTSSAAVSQASAAGGGGSGGRATVVSLSRLFRWFRRDFIGGGGDADLLAWITARAGPKAAARLAAAGSAPKLSYQKYDWQDNGDWNAKPDIRYMRVYDLSFRRSA